MKDKILDDIVSKIRHLINPDKIILFGSRARGEAKPNSDYDLLVIKSGLKSERKATQDLYEFLDVKADIDLIVKTPESIEKSKQRIVSVVKEAIKEGKVIYEGI